MVGLGETEKEILETMEDLRSMNCDILTIGQYLQPLRKYCDVKEYINPETFEYYKRKGEEFGFKYVASAPLVRSSFNASDVFSFINA